jgi:Dirigent-like protein
MRGHIRRNISIGVLVAALLASGLFVGVSSGSTGSTTVRLTFGELVAEYAYPLRDSQGVRSAELETYRGLILDEGGTRVGAHRSGWWCTHLLSLHPGAFTGEGTVVVTGLFKGFSGEQMAIVGGTGAYAGANGYVTATVEGDEFLLVLTLQA